VADLATLSAAKTYIRPDGNEDDAIIELMLGWASDRIRAHTYRRFTVPKVTATERAVYFQNTASARMDDYLTNVTKITAPVNHFVDGEPYPYVRDLTTDEYEIRQFPTVTEIRLDYPGDQKFLITGDWGWNQSEVPEDLQRLTIITVDEWYRSNIIASYEGQAEGDRREGRNISLPREVKEDLETWILRGVIA
jgi:hypothetical protein